MDLSGEASHIRGELRSDGESPDEILFHRGFAQTVQGQLPAKPVKLKLFLDRLERMLLGQHLRLSIGAKHQEARPLRAPSEERQPVHRRHVAPVQVLEP